MPISVSGQEEVAQVIEEQLQRMRLAILERLKRIGEKAVSLQRKGHKYTDRTGNLTSSIGYVVFDNGKVYAKSAFKPVTGKKGRGNTGAKEGEAKAKKLAVTYQKDGMALVVVAGMEYAPYVQAKGWNVIDTANLYIIGNAEKGVQKVIQSTIKIINEMYR